MKEKDLFDLPSFFSSFFENVSTYISGLSMFYNLDPSIKKIVKVIKLDFRDRVPVKFFDPLRSIRCMSSFF